MKEVVKINQNYIFNKLEAKNERQFMKIIDITIGFALLVVLFISVFSHLV